MASGNIISSEVRFAFCNLFKPKKGDPGKPDKYGVTMLFPHPSTLTGAALDEFNACVAALKAEAHRVAFEKWGSAATEIDPATGRPKLTLRSPFRDQADKAGEYEGYVPGALFLNVTSQQRPEIVDANVQPIIEQSKLYSGCYGRVSLRAFAYETNGKGVSFGLQNVQKTRDGEPLGGGGPASADFKPIAAAAGGPAAPVADATKLFG